MRFRRHQKSKLETVTSAVTSTPAKVVGATAAIGGAGALIAKKVRGGDPEPLDVPPAVDNKKSEATPESVETVQDAARQMAAADARACKSGPTIE